MSDDEHNVKVLLIIERLMQENGLLRDTLRELRKDFIALSVIASISSVGISRVDAALGE